MHARTEPKRIGIEHGITWIDHVELLTSLTGSCAATGAWHLPMMLWRHLRVTLYRLLVEATCWRDLLLTMVLLVEGCGKMALHLIGRRIGAVGVGIGVVEH